MLCRCIAEKLTGWRTDLRRVILFCADFFTGYAV